MQNAATRSPALNAPASERTVPATSLPGTNGRSGLSWYWPRDCSTSGKDTPAARTSILTPSPLGSSMSASCSDSGPPSSTIWIARIDRGHYPASITSRRYAKWDCSRYERERTARRADRGRHQHLARPVIAETARDRGGRQKG